MICQQCGGERWTGELIDGRAVRVCVECGAHEQPVPAVTITTARKRGRPTIASTSEPLDVIAAAKKRLAWLRREVKVLGKYQQEIDLLTRLLDAATTQKD